MAPERRYIKVTRLPTADTITLYGVALLAGAMDATVGAGGLIQIPALLVLVPEAGVAAILGTHKFASSLGSAAAVHQYHRAGLLRFHAVLPFVVVAAMIGAFLGARVVSSIPGQYVRPALLVFLVVSAVYVSLNRTFGAAGASRPQLQRPWYGVLLGFALGFYDGVIGLGAGSLFLLALVAVCGLDFIAAAAAARVVNLATNLSAAAAFAYSGNIIYLLALPLALLNVLGSVAGTRLATAGGSRLVRIVFLVLTAALILKLGHEQLTLWLLR